MGTITTIGLDIAKSVFQVHGIDATGEVVVRRRLSRGRILAFFEKLPRCLVKMEACNYNADPGSPSRSTHDDYRRSDGEPFTTSEADR